MDLLRDLGRWLWRLLPANPILVRVVSTSGKRSRYLWVRLGYLLVLLGVFILAGGLLVGAGAQPLSRLAKQATNTFVAVSVVQLLLMSLVAPVFCAGAITQEKDANTFHILLTTPLSNAQIVLGSLASRLFVVWTLLLAGLPIFCISMLYGGVTTREILESFGLAACTGLLTGSIAIMISFLRVGTRRTIFAFFAGVAAYLLGVFLLGLSPLGQLSVAPPPVGSSGAAPSIRMSWLAPVHPFLALFVVTGQTPAPTPADVGAFGWPARWLLAQPQYGYMALSTLASALMVLISLIYVRRVAREGEATLFTRLADRLLPRRAGRLHRKPRRVWHNPVAWREAVTRGSAGGRSLARLLFMLAGAVAALVLWYAHYVGAMGLGPGAVVQTRAWLTALVWIELAVALLVVTNTAATTLTREKESQTIELLLCTPLTSRYIIAGMLQGLVRLVVPLIGLPTATITLFAVSDLFVRGPSVTTLEAVPLVALLMTAFVALAAMTGLHFSLLLRKTVTAVMVSTLTVLAAAGLLSLCGIGVAQASDVLVGVFLPFAPFPAVRALIDPWFVVEGPPSAVRPTVPSGDITLFRVAQSVGSLLAAPFYLAVTWALYRAMVRDFDMTLRRQSA